MHSLAFVLMLKYKKKRYDLQNTKVSLISLFPLFKFNICPAPVLSLNQKSLVTYRILVLQYVDIYWLHYDNGFLYIPAIFV